MSRYFTSKSGTLLSDNSWIKKPKDEDEIMDRDENFGVSVLSHHRSSETLSPKSETSTTPTRTTSVQSLTKRFSASQDDLDSSSYPASRSSYTKSYTTRTSTDEPRSSTTTTTVKKNGTTETTTITTTQTLKSSVTGSPTQTFNERVKSSSKGSQYTVYSPAKASTEDKTVTSYKDAEDQFYRTLIPSSIMEDFSSSDSQTTVCSTETVTVKSSCDNTAEDKLYDTLIPSIIRTDYSPSDSKTSVFTSKTVTVKSSPDEKDLKNTNVTQTSSTAEDQLYDSLLPRSITSSVREPSSSFSSRRTSSYGSYTVDSPTTRTTSYTISSSRPSDDITTDQKRYSYTTSNSSYSGVSSPTSSIITSRVSSRSDDILSDSSYTRSSSVRSDRILHEKDLCTQCHKPFDRNAKMVLPEMKINCHATCFKCEVCNSTLGHMKAGDSLWIYRSMVHCDNCFDITREKWRH